MANSDCAGHKCRSPPTASSSQDWVWNHHLKFLGPLSPTSTGSLTLLPFPDVNQDGYILPSLSRPSRATQSAFRWDCLSAKRKWVLCSANGVDAVGKTIWAIAAVRQTTLDLTTKPFLPVSRATMNVCSGTTFKHLQVKPELVWPPIYFSLCFCSILLQLLLCCSYLSEWF